MLPFSPPKITPRIIRAVTQALRSGWITTGPLTRQFEKELARYCKCQSVLCVNSATAGLELVLRWFGVGKGDEVIVPAYTYAATANVALHCGAKPVLTDVNKNDFNISVREIEKAITSRTKVIIPVDFGGFPCHYDAIRSLIERKDICKKFRAATAEQKMLGRILLLSDAAHSIGAVYKGEKTGSLADISVFSFHAVKNLTTAEGGAICFNIPKPFAHEKIYRQFSVKSLHGQTKDAFEKFQRGGWRYDIAEAGYKCNMTDIAAAMGLSELAKYDSETLPKRKRICEKYSQAFARYTWTESPVQSDYFRESSYHLFPLRIKNISEKQRDAIMEEIFKNKISVNVHFIPLPLFSFYRKLGYKMKNYPNAYDNFSRELSLPVYYNLTDEQQNKIIRAVIGSVKKILG